VEGQSELGLNGWEIGGNLRNPSFAIQAADARPYFFIRRHVIGAVRLPARPYVSPALAMSQGC
jgi:hypothetical protein